MNIRKIVFYTNNKPNGFPFSEAQTERLREASKGAELVFTGIDEERLMLEAADCDVAVAQNNFPLPGSFFEKAPQLKWVHCLMSGVDRMDIPKGVTLTSTKGTHGAPISEHVLAMMLFAARKLGTARDNQHEKRWERISQLTELNGATAGIVGLGNIGSEVASLLGRIGMRVIATSRSVPSEERMSVISAYYQKERFDEFLAECDHVILNVPLTAESRHMFSKEQFEKMKDSAWIINVARGAVINEVDLIEALKNGCIAGACLDVAETEPLPQDSPLWEMENVLITPHVANSTPRKMERITDLLAENIRRYINDESLLYIENS
ncbi:MAG: D-2-hydroxyacid dehydrogenase [Lachnospiraceae bacterium]|nr:D-2-hydroxyacid dehydrogenase [Lachnospiraceae bacterium]